MSDEQSFGNPFTGQRDLARGNAIVQFVDRGVVALTGKDRLGYLDSLVSQEVSHLSAGESAEALLLDPHGHIERAMRIVDDGETTWLLVDAQQAQPLAAFLDRMTFSKDAAARDASAEFVTVGFFAGGVAESQVRELAASPAGTTLVWNDPWSQVCVGGWQYAAGAHPGESWNYAEALIPAGRAEELTTMSQVSVDSWDALRIAAWRPSLSSEVDRASLPHETDWLRSAVHLAKGCYRGQETVAKVHNLGHPPRRLVMLHLDGTTNELPLAGAAVYSADAEVGHITSAGRHYEDGPIALAVIKRSVDADAVLAVDAPSGVQPATQVIIVPSDAGRTIDVPRMAKLGRVSRTGE